LTTLRLTKIINGDAPSKESEFDQEDEVNFNVPEFLKMVYHELLSNSSILSKAYKNLRKDFKNYPKII